MKGSTIIYLFLAVIASSFNLTKGEKGRRFEIEHCEDIIPQFIDHISEHGDDGECGEVGFFPKPGDCTVFFKCVRGRGRILPILEYCAIGYNFDGNSCVRSSDLTDCPQFNCKMVNDTAAEEETKFHDVSKDAVLDIAKKPREMSDTSTIGSDQLQSGIVSSAAQKSMEIDPSRNTGATFRKISPFLLFLPICAFIMM